MSADKSRKLKSADIYHLSVIGFMSVVQAADCSKCVNCTACLCVVL